MIKETDKLIYGEYFRKSSEAEDRQAFSIPDQMRDVDALVKREALNVGIKFPGESKSAHTPGRQIFADVVKAIMDGKINALVVWHANRISRNPVDAGTIIWLMDIGKLRQVKTTTKTYENNADDKFFLWLELSISKKDSDNKSEVVKRALVGRAGRGIPNGVAPIGFINDKTAIKGNRRWLIDKIRLPLVEKLFGEFLSGRYSAPALYFYAKDDLKLTTMQRQKIGGRHIAKSYIYTMLRNPIYAGFFFQNDIRYELDAYLPRLLTEEEYWKIQDMLGRKGMPRVTNRKAVYNQFAICGLCGGKHCTDFKFQVICSACKKKFSHVTRKECPSCGLAIDQMNNPTFLTYVFYYCLNNKQHRTTCLNNGIEEKKIELQLKAELEQTLAISEELSTWCIENIPLVKDTEIEDNVNLKANLEQEKNALEGKLKRLTMLRISRDYSTEENTEFDKLEKEMKSNLSLLEVKLSNANVDWFSEAKKDFKLMAKIPDTFTNGTIEQKNDLLIAFHSNLTIVNKKVIVSHSKSIEVIKKTLLLAKAESTAFEPKTFNNLELNNDKTEAFASACTTLLRR